MDTVSSWWIITEYSKINSELIYHLHVFNIHTLTSLNLTRNNIDATGAQHLANALLHNRVRIVFYPSISYTSISFTTDTYHTGYQME
jgi:hypothetical protein